MHSVENIWFMWDEDIQYIFGVFEESFCWYIFHLAATVHLAGISRPDSDIPKC